MYQVLCKVLYYIIQFKCNHFLWRENYHYFIAYFINEETGLKKLSDLLEIIKFVSITA